MEELGGAATVADMLNDQEWKNKDREYHEDPYVVKTFDRRIVRKHRLEHKYYTLNKWIDELLANNAKVVMDFGCATGNASLSLLRRGIKAVSVDASVCMLKALEKKAKEEGLNAEMVLCDVEQMPFEDKSFDGVICLGVLHHLPNILQGVKEQVRVLKPGGLLFISEPFDHKPWVSIPYYILLETVKFFVRLCKREKFDVKERPLTYSDIDGIIDLFNKYGFNYEVTYFTYWPNVVVYLPERVAYSLVRLINRINGNAKQGDFVILKARKGN